ncbi:hypothetical protein HYPSUDRAFT_466075 [Hypholoma sublateritium FD-334 SS-4]|uniref:Uncharacterized protein n=1 Tax=Hypholoma sublateritium (strain FD-334 SS-4) TaxID=945553 RepID=A0A0D2P839_HYPSF|nr:hypothetical protein HYPSUDRAFT_466075 [Hypholoma sublateritium FD-334 SS-4]
MFGCSFFSSWCALRCTCSHGLRSCIPLSLPVYSPCHPAYLAVPFSSAHDHACRQAHCALTASREVIKLLMSR